MPARAKATGPDIKTGPSGGVEHAAREELRLIARVAAEDTAAFECLYRAYHPRLVRFLHGMLRQGPLVEEVLDDTMLVVWRRAHTFDGSAKLSTWLFAIAYRQALKALRQRGHEPGIDEEPAAPGDAEPDSRLQQHQLHACLADALAALSAEHRAVIELTYYQGHSCREIADIVDCPVATVKTRMFYARRRLRSALGGAREQLS
jgi:RNA polymerase sigma-70 factor (ECF subfamily)